MPRRAPGQLSALKVSKAKPGRYGDGGSPWLDVSSVGAKSRTFRFTSPVTGKVREMRLGSLDVVGLQDARKAKKIILPYLPSA
jgi:hypothetical protein